MNSVGVAQTGNERGTSALYDRTASTSDSFRTPIHRSSLLAYSVSRGPAFNAG